MNFVSRLLTAGLLVPSPGSQASPDFSNTYSDLRFLRSWNTAYNFDRVGLRQFETESNSLRDMRTEFRVEMAHLFHLPDFAG
jgi:hypothetical protein